VNREQRRAQARRRMKRVPSVEVVTKHCERCGAPYCPVCDVEMSECPDCGRFHCEECGYDLGVPVTPFFEMSLS
jgi:transcription elongation factor Elf1